MDIHVKPPMDTVAVTFLFRCPTDDRQQAHSQTASIKLSLLQYLEVLSLLLLSQFPMFDFPLPISDFGFLNKLSCTPHYW